MQTALGVAQWSTYSKFYDFNKGTVIYPENAKSKAKVNQDASFFTGLIWRSYKKVSFAVRAPWVVGRFCHDSSVTTTKAPTPVDNYENVNPVCTDTTAGSADSGYNRCYNKMALTYHNVKRANHNTDNLELDTNISKYI